MLLFDALHFHSHLHDASILSVGSVSGSEAVSVAPTKDAGCAIARREAVISDPKRLHQHGPNSAVKVVASAMVAAGLIGSVHRYPSQYMRSSKNRSILWGGGLKPPEGQPSSTDVIQCNTSCNSHQYG